MIKTLDDELLSLRKLSATLGDHIDTIENIYYEQLASVSKVNDDYEIVRECPDWKCRLKSALAGEATDSLDSFSKSLTSLAQIIQKLSNLFEDSQHHRVSETHETDLIIFLTHLKQVYNEYSNFVETLADNFTKISEGQIEKTEIKKRSLFDENFEIRSAYQRLKVDLKKFCY